MKDNRLSCYYPHGDDLETNQVWFEIHRKQLERLKHAELEQLVEGGYCLAGVNIHLTTSLFFFYSLSPRPFCYSASLFSACKRGMLPNLIVFLVYFRFLLVRSLLKAASFACRISSRGGCWFVLALKHLDAFYFSTPPKWAKRYVLITSTEFINRYRYEVVACRQ